MSSTTMHFGPEWMRTKHQTPTRMQPPPSPPPAVASALSASTYSALVSPAPPQQPEKRDDAHPFRYSKEELLKIYREGGGKGGLGLEVERWEGVVREVGSEPIGLREMGEAEKKLFQGPLNSDLRRRQSTDLLSLSTQGLGTDRARFSLNSPASAAASPLRDRFGALRRRDSADQPTLTIPRKQSFSSLQPASPREAAVPSPRRGSGYTSGFDGVLGGGDVWAARRRASEASLKAGTGAAPQSGGDTSVDGRALDIREEEEDTRQGPDGNSQTSANSQDPNSTTTSQPTVSSVSDGHDATVEMASLSLGANSSNLPGSLSAPPNSVPVVPPVDPATVEWSYKDPSGQIQGPFNAELMQKWYDDGYFTGDLPTKRTHFDSQWTTVDELVKRHGPNKTFLSPPLPVVPPGLARPDTQNLAQDPLLFNGPYQPAPIRNLRSSTLDSFGSPSDSPSSSFGAGRFGNGSPDPNAFGGRAAYFGDTAVGTRPQNFAAIPDPAAAFSRRNTFDPSLDPSLAMRSPAYGNIIPGRGPAGEGFGYNRTYSPGQGWNAVPFDGSNGNRGTMDPFSSPFVPGPANNCGNFGGSQDAFNDGATFQNVDYNHFVNGATQSQLYSPSPATQYQPQGSNAYGLQTASTSRAISSDLNASPAPSHSPWNNEAPAARRPGPFEVAHPTSANTVVVQPVVETSPWGQPSQPSRPSSQVNESSPWVPPSEGLVGDTWAAAPMPDSLTFSNVGQHNQQQEQLASATETAANDVDSSAPSEVIPVAEAAPAPEAAATKAAPPAKSKAKAATQPSQPAPTPNAVPPGPVVQEPSPPPPAPKTAWAKDDDGKTKPSGVTMSLREIQEAEAKKAEARKAAERERERAARVAAPAVDGKDVAQPFTASWGLPTSQAGARPTAPAVKEPSATPSPAGTPVWTNVPKAAVAKKTMKEIQEEEERRKKNATKETVAAATARRAYAETTQKVTTQASPGNAWTTVGPSGRPTPAAAAPARLPVTPSTSTVNVAPPRPNGNAAPRPVTASPVVKPAPFAPKNDDPVAPSHEFVTWLTGSLKGLNSSVNVEEIISMLLSFSLDPDPSTVELISELIYANSTTLDGRRFAAEFISKRKADAAARAKVAAAGKVPPKPVSIADVVKAAPKPTQPEWGFKVVNKKKKGGRS
ncbi:putative GYF domain containing protein [Lyophyllum shimeji]|uniref:GYF domain containing protein n=1 Tax=Lyophyllum shimeji TaxID=47721 RepID=A0A9P3PIE3_LYOSH|nr:putative GYF domain containing protein [Lyophyllum shimeji]